MARKKSSAFYQMRSQEAKKCLNSLIDYIGDTNINMIEIGSYTGESTIVFAERFAKVISIDPFIDDYDLNDDACYHAPFDEVYLRFLDNISDYSNITHIRAKSEDVKTDQLLVPIHFVYIDGKHTYEQVKLDISKYIPFIEEGGFIGGHDYTDNWPNVKRAVNEILGTPDATFCDGSWIKKL